MTTAIENLINDSLSEDYPVRVKADHAYDYNGYVVPSVTTILSKCIHEDYLMYWANSLGFKRKRYSEELNKAANIGTLGHNSIENYISDGVNNGNTCLQGFLLWWEDLNNNHEVEVLGMEQPLVIPYCGGTYDLLLKIDGRIFLIDFKTSNHLTYKYFIQLAAYRHMLYKANNINIDGCAILQLDKNKIGYNEQLLDFSIDSHYQFIEQCAFTFISLVLAYYNINKTEIMWRKVFS